ncbi:hypothetical protein [Methanobrevibacter sp.]|uniref:hypothetical protein n=1 Tax=Methanobrevibacter sp. TaxID=66852 RepID=UPI00388DD149
MISDEAMEALNKYFPEEVKKIREQGRAIISFTVVRRMKNHGCGIQEISHVTGIRTKGIKKL